MPEAKQREKAQLAELRQEPLSLRDEFKKRSQGLHHHTPKDFHRSQWQTEEKSCVFLIYRLMLATFFGSGLVANLRLYYFNGHWFIYLTNWGFLLCSITSISAAIFVSVYHHNPERMLNRTCLIRCFWACYWINLILAHIISIIYWTCIYPSDQAPDNPYRVNMLFNIWTHALPPLIFTLDHFLVAHPARLLHILYPFLFSLGYGAFACAYYYLGGLDPRGRVYIYPMLNFAKPMQVLKTVGHIATLMIVCCTLQYGVYRLRVFIARKLGKLQ